jgi:hypothetical protein
MIGSPAGFLFPPMLFPRNALPSGPQACFFAEKGTAKVRGARFTNTLTKRSENYLISLNFSGHQQRKGFFCPSGFSCSASPDQPYRRQVSL